MLKHLYKTLLISVISGSLLSFNPAVALADGETRTTTDNNGVITAKKNYKFDEVSDTDMMASLAMLAAGFITARMAIVYNKPLSMDAMMAGAAGAAFIAGEITTNVKFKGKIKEMTIEVEKKNDGTVNEEQVKRLEDLKASYEEAKKTTNIKKMLQMGASAGFAAAAATAGWMAYTEYASMSICLASLTAMEPNCALDIKDYQTTMNQVNQDRQYPKPSTKAESTSLLKSPVFKKPISCSPKTGADAAAVAAQVSAANLNCGKTIAMLKKNQVFTYYNLNSKTSAAGEAVKNAIQKSLPDLKMALTEKSPKSFFEKVADIFLPQAEASWFSMLGLGTGVGAAFLASNFAMAKQIDLWIYVPFNRSIIFGVLSGIALMSAMASDKVMKKLDANIQKIDAILADLNKLSKGVKAQNLTQQGIQISTINPGVGAGVSFSTDNSVKTPCMTNNSSENCESLSSKLSSTPGFANLPDSFKDIAAQTVALGDGVSGTTGISGSTLSTAESLGNKQNAIARLARSTQARLTKISNGKLNGEKAEEAFKKGTAATLKKSLEKSGMTATGLMTAIGSTPIDSSIKLPKDDDLLKTKAIVTGGAGVSGSGASDDGANSLKLDFNEQAPADTLSMGEVNATGAAPEYDIKSPDINGEFGPSLFELISGRYIKSGYPKLLEEEPAKN